MRQTFTPSHLDATVQLQYLTSSWQRAIGAMFHRKLGERVLVFVYPHPAPRLFHTFFCPPLRLLALTDDGTVVFDQVVRPGRFVRLPASRVVVELDPDASLSTLDQGALVENALRQLVDSGSWQAEASLDRLFMALLKEAVADIRRVHHAHQRNGKVRQGVLRKEFAMWERGRFAHSAGLILDAVEMYELPPSSVRLSQQVLQAEADCLEEIGAAAAGGEPWKGYFASRCLRCGDPASWRPILQDRLTLPRDFRWRLERPENHAPLCKRCTAWLGWSKMIELRLDAGRALWGRRFDAFTGWYRAVQTDTLPAGWDKHAFPLWPETYGGKVWATGSGTFRDADPRPPLGIRRTARHRQAVRRLITGPGGIGRKPKEGRVLPWQPLLELADISPEEILNDTGAAEPRRAGLLSNGGGKPARRNGS